MNTLAYQEPLQPNVPRFNNRETGGQTPALPGPHYTTDHVTIALISNKTTLNRHLMHVGACGWVNCYDTRSTFKPTNRIGTVTPNTKIWTLNRTCNSCNCLMAIWKASFSPSSDPSIMKRYDYLNCCCEGRQSVNGNNRRQRSTNNGT